MKKLLSFISIFTMVLTLAACGSGSGSGNTSGAEPPASQQLHSQESEQSKNSVQPENSGQSENSEQPESSGQPSEEGNEKPADSETGNNETADTESDAEGSHILVAYFSATGTTKALAEYAADAMGADLYEIAPQEPYTSADLNYGDSSSRSSIEQNDAGARPAISGSVDNMEQYDMVFLAYPIWLAYHNLIQCTQA